MNDSGAKSLWRKPIVHIILFIALGLIIYSNTFNVIFVFDDGPNIPQNPMIKSLSNLPLIFKGVGETFASRPLLHATTALNYHFGGLDPRGYHAVNLILHMLNAILLYLLITITGRYKGYPEKETVLTAVISALVFVAHPVQTEAVTYIVSRSMLLATMFYLLGTILFLRAVTTERRKYLYISGLFIVSLLGTASRENFVTFPVMLFLFDLFFISELKIKQALKHYKAYLPVLISLGYIAYLIVNNSYDTRAEYASMHIPALNYALTEFNVNWTYIRLLLLPINQNIDYGYPVARTLFGLPTALSFLGYAGMLAAAILLIRRRLLVSFGILWYLIALAPVSFGVTLLRNLKLDDVIFEHRLYLPSIGLIVLAGAAAAVTFGRLKASRTKAALAVALAVLLVALSSATYARNAVWTNNIRLWEDAASKSPRKARTHFNLGVDYGLRGEKDRAIREYRTAIYLEPENPMPHVNLGNAYRSMGMTEEAINEYKIALTYAPGNPEATKSLGMIYASKGMAQQAIYQYQLAISKNPNDPIAQANLGIAYKKLGETEKGEEHIQKALSIYPNIVQAFVRHGVMYVSNGQTDLAIEQFEKALVIDPDNSYAHMSLGQAYKEKGMTEKAKEEFDLAHKGVSPPDGKSHP